MVHVENELIDEACGRVLDAIGARGWGDDTDVLYTTDHGELQGDFGMLFKGPVSRRRADAGAADLAAGAVGRRRRRR